jgi:hypothetical protein
MKYPWIDNPVRGKLFFVLKIQFGYFWASLGTVGRLWAKLGFVKDELGQNARCG